MAHTTDTMAEARSKGYATPLEDINLVNLVGEPKRVPNSFIHGCAQMPVVISRRV